jgi:succinate-semialdehyde dehydrogenase/glutarate-semialdehyde dehydrogenase
VSTVVPAGTNGGAVRRALDVGATVLLGGTAPDGRGAFDDPAAPLGGAEESKLGREGAGEGMLGVMETTYVAVEW